MDHGTEGREIIRWNVQAAAEEEAVVRCQLCRAVVTETSPDGLCAECTYDALSTAVVALAEEAEAERRWPWYRQ
jgi:Zn finger protein HypA/HybF involved in hydrogenase expression